MADKTKPYKAIVAGVVTAGTAATVALEDGSINATEWITGVVAVVVAVAAVFGVRNPPA